MNGMDVVRICESELELTVAGMKDAENEADLSELCEQANDQLESLYYAVKARLEGGK